jgi:hypothetical protein
MLLRFKSCCLVIVLSVATYPVLASGGNQQQGQFKFVGIDSELFGPQWMKFTLTNTGNETMVIFDPIGEMSFWSKVKDIPEEIAFLHNGRRLYYFLLLRPGESVDYRIASKALDFSKISSGKTTLSLQYAPGNLKNLPDEWRISLDLVRGYKSRDLEYRSFPDFLWQFLYYNVVLKEDGTYWLILRSKQTEISRWKIFTGDLTCSMKVNVRPKYLRFLGVISEFQMTEK